MTELVVISGKGGTGKTTVVGALAALAPNKVVADCDVGAANLHLVLRPTVETTVEYKGSEVATINPEVCTGCGRCARDCRFAAIARRDGAYVVDPLSCEGCGVCAQVCLEEAVELRPRLSGWIYICKSPYGTVVHGELRPGEETSGKLVSQVKMRARELARLEGKRLLVVDGAPGIGCPVIASLSGATVALAVTEPSLSALHDLSRAVGVARHFQVRTYVVINKADLAADVAERIEAFARGQGLPVLGRIPYDEAVTKAQVAGRPVVEYRDGAAARAIRAVWERLSEELEL